jgi:hypothetical protein
VEQTAAYIRRAKEAEARAITIEDEELKDQWREIAIAYRNLAQARVSLITSGETSVWASPSSPAQTSH